LRSHKEDTEAEACVRLIPIRYDTFTDARSSNCRCHNILLKSILRLLLPSLAYFSCSVCFYWPYCL